MKPGVILGIIFISIGAGLGYWGYSVYQKGNESKNWPTVTGQVIESEVKKETTTRKVSDGRKRTTTSFRANVIYRYEVNGTSYISKQITSLDYSFGDSAQAREITAKYPKGKTVTVFYNTLDPEQAFLEPGISKGSYILMGAGAVCLVLGLLAGATAFRGKKKTFSNGKSQ
jgi:hypothetical protein